MKVFLPRRRPARANAFGNVLSPGGFSSAFEFESGGGLLEILGQITVYVWVPVGESYSNP